MVSEKMYQLGSKRSEIRELFEYGLKRKAEIGAENVFDFSLGNPSVPAPECVKQALADLVLNTDPVALHGYTSAQGAPDVRKSCADYVNKEFGTNYTADNFYMTVGAAASLTISLTAISEEGGEVIVLAPFFPEYTVFINQAGMTPVVVKCREEDFQVDFDALKNAINKNTKAIIVNSPNNPSGVVFSEDTIKKLSEVMKEAESKYGKEIYIIADEPYRELAYDGVEVPYLTKYYANTIVGYSFSKSLSLPGERIGYLVIPDETADSADLISAASVATRILGFVNAPTLQQKMVVKCLNEQTDISYYDRNRETLYNGLTECGFTCIKPEGAFYLFVKSPVENEKEFCDAAKKYNILIVPGSSFGCPGYVRMAYCVSYETIVNSLPKFKELAKEYF